jgi:hypothetical protein
VTATSTARLLDLFLLLFIIIIVVGIIYRVSNGTTKVHLFLFFFVVVVIIIIYHVLKGTTNGPAIITTPKGVIGIGQI